MVPLALIYLGMQGGIQKGKPYKRAELSWVYEDNYPLAQTNRSLWRQNL
jgi:hypothetical protein